MTFAMFEMSMNLEVQEKARKEVLEVLDKYEGKMTYEAINQLHYLDMVVLGKTKTSTIITCKDCKQS